VWTILVLVIAGAGAWFAVTRLVQAPPELIGDESPRGRWRTLPPNRTEQAARTADERARLLSHPYMAGRQPAAEKFGVVHWGTDRAADGVNLYVSGHGPEAVLIDMDGRVLHRWRLPYKAAFGPGEPPPGTATDYWRRVRLLPDGGLLAIFQAGGLVAIDADSKLRWSLGEGLYNDLDLLPDGSIVAISKAARLAPEINGEGPVLEDSLVFIGTDGLVAQRVSLLEMFLASSFRDLLQPMAASGDIFHTNTVSWLDGALAERASWLRRGNLLISLREVDIVAVVDPVARTVEWAQRGPWDAQHEPILLANGRFLIFDNRGAAGRARVLEYDPLTARIEWEYAGSAETPLFSPEAGSCQRLANGNTLVTESEMGRAVEVTPDGEVVWEFLSPHRVGPQRNLVATLFEVTRLPRAAVSFLDSPE
jgi:hypothetical protein